MSPLQFPIRNQNFEKCTVCLRKTADDDDGFFLMRATLSVDGWEACVSRVEARLLGSWVGAQGFRPAIPKLTGPSVAPQAFIPAERDVLVGHLRSPSPPVSYTLLSRVVFAGCSGGAQHELQSNAGQVVPARLLGVPEHGCASDL